MYLIIPVHSNQYPLSGPKEIGQTPCGVVSLVVTRRSDEITENTNGGSSGCNGEDMLVT